MNSSSDYLGILWICIILLRPKESALQAGIGAWGAPRGWREAAWLRIDGLGTIFWLFLHNFLANSRRQGDTPPAPRSTAVVVGTQSHLQAGEDGENPVAGGFLECVSSGLMRARLLVPGPVTGSHRKAILCTPVDV